MAKCNKCGHEWNYKGNSKYYITCPQCYIKVNQKKEVIENGATDK